MIKPPSKIRPKIERGRGSETEREREPDRRKKLPKIRKKSCSIIK